MGVLHGARRSKQTFFTEEVSGGYTFRDGETDASVV
jgi:hypothetical protein